MAAGGNPLSGDEIPPLPGSKFLFVQPDMQRIAVLERVDPDRQPLFVSTARTRCLWCDAWCWLGDQSMQVILAGEAAPMCMECAADLIPGNAIPLRTIQDTKWDGPK